MDMKYDWIDIGSSKGGSVRYCMKNYGLRGYGIDISPSKVDNCKQQGLDVRLMPIEDVKDTATWCVALHVIEHLSGREEARAMIKKMCEIGDNVYITLPCFDYDAYLYNHGLKFCWSHWIGHPYQPSTLELYNLCKDLKTDLEIEYFGEVLSSAHKDIVPLSAPVDSLKYDNTMENKRIIQFDIPIWREVRIYIV